MTTSEAAKTLGVIKLSYPNAWKDVDLKKQAELWAMLFADIPFQLVNAAVKEFILTDTSGFPPSPGQVNQLVVARSQQVKPALGPSEHEAWMLVEKAARNSAYHAAEEYNHLPALIQMAIGDAMRLKEIAMMEPKEHSFAGNDFRKRYRELLERPDIEHVLEEKTSEYYRLAREREGIEMPVIGSGRAENVVALPERRVR